jgi:hypothetical protein
MGVKEMMLAIWQRRHVVDCRVGKELGCDKVEQEELLVEIVREEVEKEVLNMRGKYESLQIFR